MIKEWLTSNREMQVKPMKTEMPKLHHWDVYGTKPRKDTTYRENYHFGVVARDIQEAISMCLERLPEGSIIFSVQHKGEIELITQQVFESTPTYAMREKVVEK